MRRPDFITIGHVTHDLCDGKVIIGGSAIYSGLTARNLGMEVGIVTSLGRDFSQWPLLSGFQLSYELSLDTTTFRNLYENGQRKQFIHGVAKTILPTQIPEAWQGAKMVHICPVANEVDLGVIRVFKNSLIAVTPQGWLRTWNGKGEVKPKDWENYDKILPYASVLIFSEEDIPEPEKAAQEYGKLINLVILTRGAKGATLYFQGESFHIPAFKTIEVDPTGAGDVFTAAFLVNYHQVQDPLTAARFASCVASFVVEDVGTKGIPTLSQVLKRMSSGYFRS